MGGAGPHNINFDNKHKTRENILYRLKSLANTALPDEQVEAQHKTIYENVRPGDRTEQQNTNYKGLLGHYANVIRKKREDGQSINIPSNLNETITSGFKWLSENGGESVNQQFHQKSLEVQNAIKELENNKTDS